MKKSLLLLAFALCYIYASAQFAPAEKIDLPGSGLKNFYRVDSLVYRSEQPPAEGFAALEKLGIKEVLNLRNYHKDDGKAEGTSLKLHHISVNTGRFSITQMVEALKIIRDARGPILVHCWHGSDRTGAVVAMYRIVFHGVSKEDALREMTGGGFGFHAVYSSILLTILDANIPAIRQHLGLTD